MAIDFPASPTLNQTFSSGNTNYIWDGTKWTASVTGGISLDKIEKGNTKAEVVDTGADGRFVVTTEGSERLRVDSNGDVTITDKIIHSGDTNTAIRFPAADTVSVETNGSERARIDSSGRLLVGTSSARNDFYNQTGTGSLVQLEGAGSASTNYILQSWITNHNSASVTPHLVIGKSRGSTNGSVTAVQSGDSLGHIDWHGADGTDMVPAASVECFVDGTPGANDMPGRLVFSTTRDGQASPTEAMRITSAQDILLGTSALPHIDNVAGISLSGANGSYAGFFAICRSGQTPMGIARKTNDGALVDFLQDGTIEGSISVSGTTVSYNGAHLSRWSQLPSGQERTEILRGSVLSNIDEMCEWRDEDNEQLNRMKVSDVEGDKNVSGVFQAWDDDDATYTNDFYCAMTGDFIIRIGASVTVERGDLLMSAGNGTAKPQDDDIIRSKTIAKVTSTNVSCTYDDGSYCVPCVLMAC